MKYYQLNYIKKIKIWRVGFMELRHSFTKFSVENLIGYEIINRCSKGMEFIRKTDSKKYRKIRRIRTHDVKIEDTVGFIMEKIDAGGVTLMPVADII